MLAIAIGSPSIKVWLQQTRKRRYWVFKPPDGWHIRNQSTTQASEYLRCFVLAVCEHIFVCFPSVRGHCVVRTEEQSTLIEHLFLRILTKWGTVVFLSHNFDFANTFSGSRLSPVAKDWERFSCANIPVKMLPLSRRLTGGFPLWGCLVYACSLIRYFGHVPNESHQS